MSTSYRKDIDGLRALAVLPVIFFHAGFEFFQGGYLGVDIFFVISGFLITSIIYSEISQRKFSILKFYERRARRILPALFLVSFVAIPISWNLLFPVQLKDFSQSLVAVSFFVSNILFWKESGYFQEISEEKPLIHTWSLAVEEQFYIFFPILLLLAFKINKVHLTIIILTILSLFYSDYGSRNFPDANFFLLPSRIWELGLGAISAIILSSRNYHPFNSQILSISGLVMLLASIIFFDDTTPTPSFITLIPVLGTCLIIIFTSKGTLTHLLLSNKILVGIGLISYSLYLWHQPLLAFLRIISIESPSYLMYLLAILLSFICAYISWRFVESPFRARKHNSNDFHLGRNFIFSFSIVGMTVLTLIGLAGHAKDGFPQRIPDNVLKIIDARNDVNPYGDLCHFRYDSFPIHPSEGCLKRSSSQNNLAKETKVALLGDSHAKALQYELESSLLKHSNILFYTSTYEACPPARGIFRVDNINLKCDKYNEGIYNFLDKEDFDVYVLLGRWAVYSNGNMFNNQEGGIESGPPHHFEKDSFLSNPRGLKDQNRENDIITAYLEEIYSILAKNKTVILIYPIPEVGWHVPDTLAKMSFFSNPDTLNISTSRNVFHDRQEKIIDAFNSIKHKNLIRIFPEDFLCKNDRCVSNNAENIFYFDDDHLSNQGNKLFADLIAQKILSS
jgi:peptidoglycan/LPS O-acetylase OafA/YrhL